MSTSRILALIGLGAIVLAVGLCAISYLHDQIGHRGDANIPGLLCAGGIVVLLPGGLLLLVIAGLVSRSQPGAGPRA